MGTFPIPVLIIFGPTASGKTSVVERLFSANAQSFYAGKAEIISADSMQVYKGLDIGTAKPDTDLLKKLPHHLIDMCSPSEQFGTGEFVRHADEACKEIFARGKLPVVAGGTAFYIKNFMYGLPVTPEADEDTRNRIKQEMETLGAELMLEKLRGVDPITASRLHVHDEYRIKRALEVYVASGKPLSEFELSAKLRSEYVFCAIALERPREELYERINARVFKMMQQGLFDEVKNLVQQGYTESDPGMKAIGYGEFFVTAKKQGCSLAGVDTDAVTRLIQSNSRRYAKRQITFIKALPDVEWIPADDADRIEKKLSDFLRRQNF